MLNPVRSRFSLAVGALLVMTALPAAAGPSIEDSLALSMSKGLRDRMFWNLSVVSTKTKTKSEQPRDMTPEIVSIQALSDMRADLVSKLPAGTVLTGSSVPSSLTTDQDKINWIKQRYYGTWEQFSIAGTPLLDAALQEDYGFAPGEGYLTTPQGIRAKSGNPSETAALSVGFYLNDDQNWAVEALVLGAPLRASVYGAGTNDRGEPNQLVGKEIIRTKMLPPIAKFGYYFGNRDWVVRPYVGVAAMYAIFFDTKTTSYFDEYQGGKTSISLKNAFGVGPFIGLQSDVAKSGWNVGLSVGKIKIKTEATLVTRGTMFGTGSLALQDYKQVTLDAINNGEELVLPQAQATEGRAGVVAFPNGFTTELVKDLAAFKQAKQGGDGTLGTFVRKQRSTLDNTILMLSVGKSF